MKKNKFRKFLSMFLVLSFLTIMTIPSFAVIHNGYSITKDSSGNINVDGTTYAGTAPEANGYVLDLGNNVKFYFVNQSERDAVQAMIATAKDPTNGHQDLGDIRDKAVNEVEGLRDSLHQFAPSVAEGLDSLGPEAIAGIKKVLSIGVGALWIIYFVVIIINGAVILVPGLTNEVSGGSGGGFGGGFGGNQSYGQSGKGSMLKPFIWKSTTKIVNSDTESPIKDFIKALVPSMIFMVVLTVCLFNGLLVNIVVFIMKFFK